MEKGLTTLYFLLTKSLVRKSYFCTFVHSEGKGLEASFLIIIFKPLNYG